MTPRTYGSGGSGGRTRPPVDRRTERAIRTLILALKLAVVVGAAWALWGCGGPTEPDPLTDRQASMVALTQCYAEAQDIDVETQFVDHPLGEAKPGDKGWARLPGHYVAYLEDFVETAPREELRALAVHEVCHVSLMTGDERAVKLCILAHYEDCQ